MDTTKAARRYFLMVNSYRNSTSHGFANTWKIYECADAAQRAQVLREGLPVNDAWYESGKPVYSTLGIRSATPQEIREAKRDERLWNYPVDPIEAVF